MGNLAEFITEHPVPIIGGALALVVLMLLMKGSNRPAPASGDIPPNVAALLGLETQVSGSGQQAASQEQIALAQMQTQIALAQISAPIAEQQIQEELSATQLETSAEVTMAQYGVNMNNANNSAAFNMALLQDLVGVGGLAAVGIGASGGGSAPFWTTTNLGTVGVGADSADAGLTFL